MWIHLLALGKIDGASSPVIPLPPSSCFRFDATGFTFDSTGQTFDQTICPTATPSKVGGDDAPRYEIWEEPRKAKKRDEALDKVIREAYDKIRGITPPVTVEVLPVAIPAYDESDDEEAILLLM